MISHKPGALTLVLGMVGRALKNVNPFGSYSTAALAVFDFDVDIRAGIRLASANLSISRARENWVPRPDRSFSSNLTLADMKFEFMIAA